MDARSELFSQLMADCGFTTMVLGDLVQILADLDVVPRERLERAISKRLAEPAFLDGPDHPAVEAAEARYREKLAKLLALLQFRGSAAPTPRQ